MAAKIIFYLMNIVLSGTLAKAAQISNIPAIKIEMEKFALAYFTNNPSGALEETDKTLKAVFRTAGFDCQPADFNGARSVDQFKVSIRCKNLKSNAHFIFESTFNGVPKKPFVNLLTKIPSADVSYKYKKAISFDQEEINRQLACEFRCTVHLSVTDAEDFNKFCAKSQFEKAVSGLVARFSECLRLRREAAKTLGAGAKEIYNIGGTNVGTDYIVDIGAKENLYQTVTPASPASSSSR